MVTIGKNIFSLHNLKFKKIDIDKLQKLIYVLRSMVADPSHLDVQAVNIPNSQSVRNQMSIKLRALTLQKYYMKVFIVTFVRKPN